LSLQLQYPCLKRPSHRRNFDIQQGIQCGFLIHGQRCAGSGQDLAQPQQTVQGRSRGRRPACRSSSPIPGRRGKVEQVTAIPAEEPAKVTGILSMRGGDYKNKGH
jgi:hypothetical protein